MKVKLLNNGGYASLEPLEGKIVEATETSLGYQIDGDQLGWCFSNGTHYPFLRDTVEVVDDE